MIRRFLIWLLFAGLVAPAAVAAAEEAASRKLPEFNRLVLEEIEQYPTDGTHDYWWPRSGEFDYDGVTQDLFLDGVKVLSGEPEQRTFCCGLTLEVFLNAYKEYLEKHGDGLGKRLSAEEWGEFQGLWFVKEINGPGPSAALEEFGLGREISREEVLPGDFVQIWRRWDQEKKSHGSGHSVIFLEWVRDESGEISGMKYFSTQPSTDGIRENIEYFGGPDETSGIAEEFTYYGRVDIPLADQETPGPTKE